MQMKEDKLYGSSSVLCVIYIVVATIEVIRLRIKYKRKQVGQSCWQGQIP